MEKMLNVAGKESSRYVTRQKYPHISQLIASYTVGRSTQDRSLCASLFPCKDGNIQDIEVGFVFYRVPNLFRNVICNWLKFR